MTIEINPQLYPQQSPGIGLNPPASTGPESLYHWARDHTVQLKRILEDLKTGVDQQIADIPPPGSLGPGQLEDVKRAVEEQTKATTSALQSAIDALGVEIEAIDGMTPQQIFELSLATRTEQVLGSAGDDIADALDWSQRSAESALDARLRGYENGATIRTVQTTQATDSAALAQQIQTVTAAIDVVEDEQAQIAAQVQNETTARANGDLALAQQVQTVSSTVAGNTSSVTQLQQAVDGVESRWGVAVNQNGQVLGTVQLSGDAQGATFAVIVDNFVVAKPDGTGATPVFAVGNVDGQSVVGIKGNLLLDGSVLARHIAAGQIDAAKLNVDSLSAISANFGDAVFTGVAKSSDDKLIIDFDAPRIRMVSSGSS